MASSPNATRRRQRSIRLTAAAALLIVGISLVAGAISLGRPLLTTLAAVVAILLGIAATALTHAELMRSRRETNRVRAEQTQAFSSLAAARSQEHLDFVSSMTERLVHKEVALGQLEDAVCNAQHRAADTARTLKVEQRRAELAELKTMHQGRKLDEAEERAAEAIVRVAELEQEREALLAELDVLRAELEAWRSVGVEGFRKHA